MRRLHRLLLSLTTTLGLVAATLLGVGTPSAVAHEPGEEYEVLFFHHTTGFRHESIEDALQAVQELGSEHGFTVTETQDPSVFNDESLRNYAAVVFYTDGEGTLDAHQRTAFERYIHGGGGFVGLHSTANMDTTDWPWWSDLMGDALFDNHPPIQDGTMHVEDTSHPATAHLGETWEWPQDEWYNFTGNPRDAGAHVLLTVDESTYDGGEMGEDHPVAWCSEFDGGRAFYTAIGHSGFHYEDPDMRQHIAGAIEWAAGVVDGDCGEPREGVPTEAAFEKVALDDNTENPMKMDIAPDGRVFYTELAGTLKVWEPGSQAVSIAGELDVYRDHENGLLGVALDPDFEENNWIYLYYSDPEIIEVDGTTGGVQHLSRFEIDPETNSLIMDSEVVLLEVEHQRQECCHSSGGLEFDSQGNLYLSTGDDTNPFGSQNFAPIDYRDGRAPWDAARSSGNTNDLRGKVLRITPLDDPGPEPGLGSTYTVPDDNLFTEANDTYHHLFPNGEFDPELARPEIYVMGLRNPFGIGINEETDELWIGDVGPDANPSGGFDEQRGPRGYDSWTVVSEAGNYGWPFCYIRQEPYRQWDFETETAGEFYDCENGAVNDSPRNTGLEQLPPATSRTLWYPYCPFTAPPPFPDVLSGDVEGGQNYGCGRSAFGGDVYNYDPSVEAEGQFPEYYDGKPFLLEWERDIIATIDVDDNGDYVPDSFEEFGFRWRLSDETRFRKPHDIQFGPDGNMYLIEWGDEFNFAGGGVNPDSGLYRISYVKGGRTPVAELTATPDSGQAPLEVDFSSEGSHDPDGEDITYEWNFGDGATSTEPNPTHVYDEPGVYQAQLTVTDTTDRSSSSTVTITVGNTRPEVTIEFPPHGKVFEWGDEIDFEVSVVDAEEGSTDDGGIDCADVTVQRGLWHSSGESAHVHPGPSQNGCTGTIVTQADADHGEDADLATVVTASYTDNGGHEDSAELTGGVTHFLQPNRKQAQYFGEADGVSVSAANDSQTGGSEAISGSGGAWASYEPFSLDDVDQLTLRASALDDTTVEVRRDAPDGDLLATAQVESTVDVGRIDGPAGFDRALQLNSSSPNEYVELPEGIVSEVNDFTISTWVNWDGGQTWTRVFDFGSGTGTYMFLTPSAGGTGNLRYAITTGGNGGEQQINADQPLPSDGWHHVAVTLSGTTGTLYLDGEPVGTNDSMTLTPADLGVTEQNWIGDSQWDADPLVNAAVDDFHLFDRALSPAEVQSLMDAPGGDTGGGNLVWYQFDEDGGTTVADSSGQDNHGVVGVSDTLAAWQNVTVDLAESSGTFPLYLVFPDSPARVNWMHFGEPPEDPGTPDPDVPICEDEFVVDRDDFDGADLDSDRWTVVEPDSDNLAVEDGQLRIQAVTGRDFYADGGTLPNVVVQDLPGGAWTATTSMEWAPTQNYQNAGLVVWQDEDNYIKAGMVHSDGREFELIKETGASPEFLGTQTLGSEFPDQFQLRYVYDGEALEAQFSADGESWTTIGSTDLSGLADPTVGMYATNSTGADATEPPLAAYDWFSVEYADEAPERSVGDSFDGDQLDGCRWDRVVRYDTDLLDVSDGALHVTTTDQDIFADDDSGMPNLVLQSAPDGDWTVETKMHAPLQRTWQNAGLLVYGDDDNYVKAGIVATSEPGAERTLSAELAAETGGTPDVVNEEVAGDVDDWWLRLTKEGSEYSFEWRAEGTAEWTALGSTASIELDDPAFGLYATGSGEQGDGEEVTVSWDCFALAGEDAGVCPEPVEPPTVTASLDPGAPDGDNDWYVSPVTVSLEVDQPEADVEYRLEDSDWTAYDEPVTVSDDGQHTLEHRATGPAGTSETASVEFSIDQAAPETSAAVDGEPYGDDGYLGEATVSLQAEDATSGVAVTEYRMAGAEESAAYEEPVTLAEPGEHTVEFRSVDEAGNAEEWQAVTVHVVEDDCPDSDTRETVVVGDVDSGVVNYDAGDGCTVNDLIRDGEDWPNHGQFVRHVRDVTGELADDGVLTSRETRDINRAGARSDVGRPGRGGPGGRV